MSTLTIFLYWIFILFNNNEIAACYWLKHENMKALNKGFIKNILSETEYQKANRLKNEPQRIYIISRIFLRLLLSHHFNYPPQRWRFKSLEKGKPILDMPELDEPLYFNISHCNRYCAIILSQKSPVGIDTEKINRDFPIDTILPRLSSDERSHISSCNPQEKHVDFFRIWTLKEAFLKLIGQGLYYPLNKFSIGLDPILLSLCEESQNQLLYLEESNSFLDQVVFHQKILPTNQIISTAIVIDNPMIEPKMTWKEAKLIEDQLCV